MPDPVAARPKILFAAVSIKKGAGGIAELSRQIVAALLELNSAGRIDLCVHVLDDAGPEPGDTLFQGSNLPQNRWFDGRRWSFALSLFTARAQLLLLDHVGLARLPSLIPQWVRTPYVLFIHGIEIWKQQRTDYHRSARNAEFLISNSEYTASKSRACYPDLPEIRICLPGKDMETGIQANADIPDFEMGPHDMLIVGRLSAEQRHKGHDHLLDALPLILARVPDARLIIAGGGDDRVRLEKKVVSLKLAGQVIFTGWLDQAQLNRLYQHSALFVMPSKGDGFGLVFLEAMMQRLPCVGLTGTAANEILEDGVAGVLVDREDRQEMANQLTALLLDPGRRQQLADAAFDRYQQVFQASHFKARLNIILEPVLKPAYVVEENQ